MRFAAALAALVKKIFWPRSRNAAPSSPVSVVKPIMFPHGLIWILADDEEVLIGKLNGGLTLFLFSDDDLARTFGEKHDMTKKVVSMRGNTAVAFLEKMRGLAVTHVSVDAASSTSGMGTAPIERVIENVRQQTIRDSS